MTSLVEWKQALKVFYIRYERYVNFGLKFVLALASLLFINSRLHYQETLTSILLVLPVSLLCAALPVGFTAMVDALFILGHLYKLSLECFAMGAVLFLIMYLLYYRFSPQDTAVLVLMPLLFLLKIPYVMPLVLGLLMTPLSILSMAFGIIVWFFMQFIAENATTFSAPGGNAEEIIGHVRVILDGMMGNRTMLVYIITFAVVLVVVYFLRRLSVNRAWLIAIIAGGVVNLIVLLIGDLMFDTNLNMAGMILGTIGAVLCALVIMFFAFHLDFERVEKVQFEDDDYYYYVKAIPKVVIGDRQPTVKSINRATAEEEAPVMEKARESVRDTDRETVRKRPAEQPAEKKKKRSTQGSGYLTKQREDAMRLEERGSSRKRTRPRRTEDEDE